MHELVELIVEKYDGSLKAEHGTGVNMAPYVEREWGRKATEMMWRIKQLADPDGVLGPGIVLNRDPGVHSGCCGMAGDRGWLHPELPASALRDVADELRGRSFDACVSSNRTCEAALHEVTGRPYSSFVLALERVTRS